jgi:exopolyphosphatase / guanosine-5'-triphosphate,3'-diphosphate pyrophosphatase
MRVAAIDVGTNTLLLLVVEGETDGGVKVIEDRCRIERLGKGVDKRGELDPQNVAGALEAVREYASVIRGAGVERVRVVGTQALREAKNGAAFLGPARELLGVEVEVIGGEREAELAWLAVIRSFPGLAAGELTVFDIGGGSTEIIVGREGKIASRVSLPIGAVRMTERYVKGDPPGPEEARALTAGIDAALAEVTIPQGTTLVGTAGTLTTLAAVAIGLDPYDADRVQGMKLTRAEVGRQLAKYLEVDLERRKRIRGLEPKRADVIAAGAAIADRVMARAGAEEVVVSDRGIRWGVAYELLEGLAR